MDSLYYPYETSMTMTTDDIPQENPCHHLTQHYNGSQQSPGAEAAVPPTLASPWKPGPSMQHSTSQGNVNSEEDLTRMLTQVSANFQRNEHQQTLYPPTPPRSESLSPSSSQTSRLHASIPGGRWNPSFPAHNISQQHLHTHTRSSSHPSLMPTQALCGGRWPAGAYLGAGVPQQIFPSTVMHPTPLSTPLDTSTFREQPPHPLHETADLAHLVYSRRHSEADALNAQCTHMSTYTPAHTATPVCQLPELEPDRSNFSVAPPTTSQAPCSGFSEAGQGPSIGTEGGNLPDESASTLSGSQDDWMSVVSVTPSPEPLSLPEQSISGVPSQTVANSTSPQNDILPSSPGPPGNDQLAETPKNRRAAKGLKSAKCPKPSKRPKNPLDPKAAKRLDEQRKTDDEHIRVLENLFVPPDQRDGLKKFRLQTIVRYATEWMETHKRVLSYAGNLDRVTNARGDSFGPTEGRASHEERHLGRSGDGFRGLATYLDTNDVGLNDTTQGWFNDTHELHNILLDRNPNHANQPT